MLPPLPCMPLPLAANALLFCCRRASPSCMPLPLAANALPDAPAAASARAGAYGLPQLKATPGFKYYDDPEEPFIFVYPKAWVRRRNMQREGLIISDFQVGFCRS